MNSIPPITIAIDGFSSSGKSTMARALARRIGFRYIDSGAMYRAVTLYALENGLIVPGTDRVDVPALVKALPSLSIDFALQPDGSQHTLLDGRDIEKEIREMNVSDNVSVIAAIPEVRHDLVRKQQQFGVSGGIVMDGRDIGTTVFPDAELKIFVNAPAETRAQRRFLELQQKGVRVNYEDVLANVVQRDHIDSTRAESPLRRADDAVDLDNSHMTIEQQDAWLDDVVRRAVLRSRSEA